MRAAVATFPRQVVLTLACANPFCEQRVDARGIFCTSCQSDVNQRKLAEVMRARAARERVQFVLDTYEHVRRG